MKKQYSTSTCYGVKNGGGTWEELRTGCSSEFPGSQLAAFYDEGAQVFVEAQVILADGIYWLGYRSDDLKGYFTAIEYRATEPIALPGETTKSGDCVAIKFTKGTPTIVVRDCDDQTGILGGICSVPLTRQACGAGWTEVNGACYYSIESENTFLKQLIYCSEMGGDLAMFQTKEDQDAVISQLSLSTSKEFWTGFQQGYVTNPANLVKDLDGRAVQFSPSYKDTKTGVACVTLEASSSKWGLKDCSGKKPAICQKHNQALENCPANSVKFGKRCISIRSETQSEEKARETCLNVGGHTISIETAGQQEFLTEYLTVMGITGRAWLGLKEGQTVDSYEWYDGEPYGLYTNWKEGKPNDGQPLSCIYIDGTTSLWADVASPCDQKYTPICEYVNTPCRSNSECLEDVAECSNGQCRCKTGYHGDGMYKCEDINECDKTPCDTTAIECQNSIGSFTCVCPIGFTGDGTPKSPCFNPANCRSNSDCNKNGICATNSSCVCNAGYEGDGKTSCENINECKTDTDDCDPNADCEDTAGSFKCICKNGYTGDGKKCTAIPKTCQDIYEKDDSASDGMYYIDPDFEGLLDKIRVKCKFVGGIGITIFEHNRGAKSEISRNVDAQSNKRTLIYKQSVTLPHITSVVDQSGFCKQSIQFYCQGPLSYVSNNAWVDRNGKRVSDLAGAFPGANSPACPCGIIGACDDGPSFSCNCNDQNSDREQAQDFGIITDRKLLPLTILLLGGTTDGKRGWVSVGPLECGPEQFGLPKDCSDAKKNYDLRDSGVQLIDVDGKEDIAPFPVYCNLDDWSNTPITEVPSTGLPTPADGPGDKGIPYPVPTEGLKKLAEGSAFCMQDIEYTCVDSPVSGSKSLKTFFKDSSDNPLTNFIDVVGAADNICPCGIVGFCANDKPKCNCDNNDGEKYIEFGTIINKGKLPVTVLNIGSIEGEAGYTIGRLRCGAEQFGIYGSCQELRYEGYTRSGAYYIDPDGAPTPGSTNNAPFLVQCEFDPDKQIGITILPAVGYSYPSEGEPEVSYPTATNDQISGLTTRSAYCTQEITYKCKKSAIFRSGANKASWFSLLDGAEQTYFDGDGKLTDTCACGIAGNCEGGGKCACDIRDTKNRQDTGLLTDKDQLPIGKLRITDLGSGGTASFEIGPLKCYELFETCEILKKEYQVNRGMPKLTNGQFVIDPDLAENQTPGFAVYCQFPRTKVYINKEDRDEVTKSSTPKCVDIRYAATVVEMKLLAAKSKVCQQEVFYQALGASFSTQVDWTDINGDPGKGFGGSNGADECACGVVDKCAGGVGDKCNTDRSNETNTDRGWLIDKEVIPVTKMCMSTEQNAPSGAYGKYKFSDLLCGPTLIQIYTDCQEYRRRGEKTTQALLIDPDGSRGVAPFTVWCEMTVEPPTGVTVITGKDESCRDIPAKGGDIVIAYNAAQQDQIDALKDKSVYCFQEMYYKCKNAELDLDGAAGWYAADGTEMKSWAGNSAGVGCAGGTCQCNIKDNDLFKLDGGKLLDKDSLPVSKVNFNAISNGGERCINVKSLRCYDIYEDCQQIKQLNKMYNINRNNRYAIDPDKAGGVDFFGVTCDFVTDSSMGITIVPTADVIASEDEGNEKVNYQAANITQVKSLVAKSSWCRQKLEYTCQNALLINDNSPANTFFRIFDGKKSNVWAGADGQYGKTTGCACALVDFCPVNEAGGKHTCKCDVKDGKERIEGGLVTNRDIMPIDSVFRGELDAEAVGIIEVGDVRCAPKPFSLPKDCEEVENAGSESGEYLIWPDSAVDPFLVYCDMTIKTGTGVTVVKPTEKTIEIGSGDNPVTYLQASALQLYHLVTESKKCYQPIRVLCNNFPLFDSAGKSTLAWLNQGSASVGEKTYFGQSSSRGNECSCGSINSCGGNDGKAAMQKRHCNCDIGGDRVDAGVLRETADFPLVGFKNSGTAAGSLTIVLGNLYCADSEIDLDVCNTDFQDCHINATCLKQSNNGYSCECQKGWRGLNRPDVWANGRECYDDDECGQNPCNNAITATCVNTPGSYYCKCNDGFTLDKKDKDVCEDFDECTAGSDNCHKDATCINIYGSFVCACNRGFRGNGTHCEPIGECVCWGDPHCRQFDNKMFHFYDPCSYTMARDNCVNGVPQGPASFQIDQINWRQGRTDTRAAWIEAVRITVYGSEVILGQKKRVTVDGILVPGFSARPLSDKGKPDLLVTEAGPYVRVTTDQGFEVRWDGKTKVDIVIGANYQNSMCGMCGNFNGNPDDDLVAGAACPKTSPGTAVTNANLFACSWRSGGSFDFKAEQCDDCCDNPLVEVCKTEGDAVLAERDCKQMFAESFVFWSCLQRIDSDLREMMYESCKIDLCAGDDKCDYAEDLADYCQQTEKVTIIGWRSGSYCGAKTCGENMEYKTSGSVGQPTCVYPDGVPSADSEGVAGCFCKKGFVLENEKCVKAEDCGCWETVKGVYIAREDKLMLNCSYLCTCTPKGLECKDHKCMEDSTCTTKKDVLDCYCNKGYEKVDDETCEDIDECSRDLDNCHDLAKCTNLVPSFSCKCNDGYEGDGVKKCDDIDECTQGTNNCDIVTTNCKNSAGAYECKCKTGYSRVNATHCQDVDECKKNRDNCDPVSTECKNTEGSFKCLCKDNFRPFDDSSCEDINECDEKLDNCHDNATCRNSLGTFTCTCKTGFKGNGTYCEDIDECKQNTDTCCEHEYCTNTIGGFTCQCSDGFVRNAQQVCEDIDECQKKSDNCTEESAGGKCTNVDGSYSCSCINGYNGDGMRNGTGCTDVDECTRPGPAICGEHSKCSNLVPGYTCKCEDGYESLTKDGKKCQPIPTCDNTDLKCAENSTCQDTGKGPSCKCNNGYTRLDDKTCTDINECEKDSHHCKGDNMVCENNVGGYSCGCVNGYSYSVPLHECQDIDECTTGDYKCMENSYCTNTNGSYECNCDNGYVKKNTGDAAICDNVNECEMGKPLCDENAKCTDTPGSYKCTCNDGYTGNGVVCNELPKCDDSPCAVHAICTDYPGGYNCQCIKGYEGLNCTNVDECDRGLSDCSPNSECVDTPGGYICRCRVGFEGHCDDCWDIDECNTGLHDCKTFSNCINTVGSYRCECEAGYIFRDLSKSCQDINECMLGIDKCNTASQNCINIRGSYTCVCKEGFRKNDAGDCEDINECIEGCEFGCSLCDAAAECTNTQGSYVCTCNVGFSGDGKICTADDPDICGKYHCDPNADCIQRSADPTDLFCLCKPGFTGSGVQGGEDPGCTDVTSCAASSPCSGPGSCVNTEFGQLCACPKGYVTIGYECIPTDPCDDPYACPAHATCVSSSNVDFDCACNIGYEMDDVTSKCIDIDECSSSDTFECPSKSECVNFDGSYACICEVGYRKNSDKTKCEDIDECLEGVDNCDEETRATCTNTKGGFTCECLPYFDGNGIVCLEQEIPGCPGPCPELSYCASTLDGPVCQCRDGYEQTSAEGQPLVCEDIDECALNPCIATNAVCVNRPGGVDCVCPLGFEGLACEDVNECDDPRTCSPDADCANSEGSYECTCREGFKGDGEHCYPLSPKDDPCKCGLNGICDPETMQCTCKFGFSPDYTRETDKCQDIDDCKLPDTCHPSAKCATVLGGYYCECPNGLKGDGVEFCTKDMCTTNTDCDENAECKVVDEIRECVCKDGYRGDGVTCTPDGNPCTKIKCPENSYCTTTLDNTPLCECYEGFHGNGDICKDIDECIEYPPPCHETSLCENSPGTYTCKCAPGYKPLDTLDGACQDINECAEALANCDINAECSNELGTYSCKCREGFMGDGKSCQPDNACISLGGCPDNSTCSRNAKGGYACVCNDGFLMKDGACEEVNECLLNMDNCAGNQKCIDTYGSYECVCLKGYEKSGTICVDINECAEADKNCPKDTTCVNKDGSYTCVCTPGLIYDGKLCIANDACAGNSETGKGKGPCHANATCTNKNTPAGFECVCNPGFVGNGLDCIPVDPCETKLCQENARCDGSDGTPVCECIKGYKDNGSGFCIDVDECAEDTDECSENGECKDDEGSYTCTCKTGFVGNGKVCLPKDPCSTPDVCSKDATCAVKGDGAECTCKPGFTGNGKECTRKSFCDSPDADCPSTSDCAETPGSFKCICKAPLAGEGYECTNVNNCANFDEDVCGETRYCKSEDKGKAQCECTEGYAPYGESQCEDDACGRECADINECNLPNDCSENAECVNEDGGYSCKCKAGFEGNGKICLDVNECQQGVCGAGATCFNKEGSCACACPEGSQPSKGPCSSCEDIDECATEQHNCQDAAECVNEQPGFSCKCRSGFRGTNGIDCIDIDECMETPGICGNGECSNKLGSYNCDCPEGYYFDKTTCTNVDECSLPPGAEGSAQCVNALCKDLTPGYECECKQGYERESDMVCKDINECDVNPEICEPTGACVNQDGSYTCTCPEGYEFNGETCEDINECGDPDICGHPDISVCVNIAGGHQCLCRPGYKYNGRCCTDVDECTELENYPCDISADCVNNEGGYECICQSGYEYINNKCIDIDECSQYKSPCGDTGDCENTEGGYRCTCREGYIKRGLTCEPICDFDTCRPYEHCRVFNNTAECGCDCSGDDCVEDGEVCGSDGRTYTSMKELMEQRCAKQVTITKMYKGKCITSCDEMTCEKEKFCEVVDGLARCTCRFQGCTLAGLKDKVCSTAGREYRRCLFFILKCMGRLKGEEIMNNGSCVRDECIYKPWSSWAPCTVSCGAGSRSRSRKLAPATYAEDLVCDELDESKDCLHPACPGDACDKNNPTCMRPESMCVDRNGRATCECPVCDTEPIKQVCGIINGKQKTYKNLCHFRFIACQENALDHTFLHEGPCGTGQNLPLACTLLPFYSKVTSSMGTSRDIVRTNRCYGGCGTEVGVCCLPQGVQFNPVIISQGNGTFSANQFGVVTSCECTPRTDRPELRAKLLDSAIAQGFIIPDAFHELMQNGLEAEPSEEPER